jgi:hypothetical protein
VSDYKNYINEHGYKEIKCECGVMTYTDGDRISHDCDYYPADIMEHDNFWGA